MQDDKSKKKKACSPRVGLVLQPSGMSYRLRHAFVCVEMHVFGALLASGGVSAGRAQGGIARHGPRLVGGRRWVPRCRLRILVADAPFVWRGACNETSSRHEPATFRPPPRLSSRCCARRLWE